MTDRELCEEAVKQYGREAQIEMVIEECAELIVALKQWQRKRIHTIDVVEEIADVEIMVEQSRVMFGDSSINDAKRAKLDRLRMRLAP
jgi:hypothetical protein